MPRPRAIPAMLRRCAPPPPPLSQCPCFSAARLRFTCTTYSGDTLTTQAARNANATFTFLRNLPNKAVAIYLNELDLSVARVRPSEIAEFDRVAAVAIMPEVPHLPSPPPTLTDWHACLSVPVLSPRGPASAPHSVHGSCREPSPVSHSPTPAGPLALRGQIKPVAKRPRGPGRPRLV